MYINVSNLTSERSNGFVQNQFIIDAGKYTIFQSYKSRIVTINWKTKTIIFGKDWHYSRTTDRHRNTFFKMYGMHNLASTELVKQALKNGYIDVEKSKFRVIYRCPY